MSNELATPPKAPKNDLRSFISGDAFKQQVALALPKHMTPDRFARVALTALTKTPKLLDCTRESLLRCLMDCSQFGLEPDGRHAHLIPYKDTCTLIIDYKGLMALARRSGSVAVFRGELVKEKDEFDWENGRVSHRINWREDRGKTECVYSYVKFTDGSEDWEVLTLAEVSAIRARSRAGNAGPWVTDFDEMAKKTAIRRHSKRLTLSPEFSDAVDRDDDRDERVVREVKTARVPEVPLLPEKPSYDPDHDATGEPPVFPSEKKPPASAREEVERRAAAVDFDIVEVLSALQDLDWTDAGLLDEVQPNEWAKAAAQWKDVSEVIMSQREGK